MAKRGGSRGVLFVAMCCAVAGAKVFVFSAAIPFFHSADEQYHYDMVVKYASGKGVPTRLALISRETVADIAMYASWEPLFKPGHFAPEPPLAPAWKTPPAERAADIRMREEHWRPIRNFYTTQPALYYMVAGAWMRLGRFFGIGGIHLMYWVRFLNILPGILAVIIGAILARRYFGEDRVMVAGVPLLLAVFPQDVSYAINSDVPAAALVGGAFLALVPAPAGQGRGWGRPVMAGFLAAAAVLTKLTNLPLLAGLYLMAVVFYVSGRDRVACRRGLRDLFAGALVAAAVVAAWSWAFSPGGDGLPGIRDKLAHVGWKLKSPLDILNHPAFSLSGCAYFFSMITLTFWRGDMYWYGAGNILAGWDSDIFYVLTTLLFLGALLYANWFRRGRAFTRSEKGVIAIGLSAVACGVLFLSGLSVVFDFGGYFFPEKGIPYFSGRLASGATVPFVLAYMKGYSALIGYLPARLRKGLAPVALVALAAAYILFSELRISTAVFASEYNWFHLR